MQLFAVDPGIFGAAWGIGIPNVGLAVNGRNTAALALDESGGFVRARTRDRWVRPIQPVRS